MTAMEWHGYRVVQEDVWFFRDGKPSVAGADHYLHSIFPPFPSTLYGLVRTQQLLEAGVDLHSLSASKWAGLPGDLRERIGEWGSTGTLRLRGPWIVEGKTILLPAPLDLLVDIERAADPAEDRVLDVLRLLPADHARGSCNWSHPLAPMSPYKLIGGEWIAQQPEKEPESSAGWLVTLDGMRRWLSGSVPECGDFVPARRLWTSEVRTGVGLTEKRRTHAEHQLYTFGFVRMKPEVSLGFELGGGTLAVGSIARFGGENRVARIEEGPMLSAQPETSDIWSTEGSVASDGCVTTLLTPAIFPGGSIPADQPISSAVIQSPLLCGGWDLAHRKPKALHRAAPAGSIYWVDGKAPPHLHSWSNKAEEGFGLMLAGQQPRRNHG